MKVERVALYLVFLCAFLAAVIGGYISQDQPFPLSNAFLGTLSGSSEAASTSHWLLCLVLSVAALISIWVRRVEPLPSAKIGVLLVIFTFFILASTFLSSYKFPSLLAACEWLTYLLAFYCTVALVGRTSGPRLVLWAMVAGATFVALRGILEFAGNSDPSWRIFAGWIGPNAVATVFLIGVFGALGLREFGERHIGLLAGFAALVCGCALWLTQSKGGLLSLAVGLVVFALMSLVRRGGFVKVVLAGVLVFGGLGLGFVLQKQQARKLGASGSVRVLSAGATQEQSGGYRMNLWKAAGLLVKQNPVGYGIGTYRFHSAKPGRTPQTQLTHNSVLQLAVEIGPVGALALVVMIVLWLIETLRGARSTPESSFGLRKAVLAAVVALMAHSMFDSDLYIFGIGILLFMLLGLGLQLAPDGTTFEFTNSHARVLLTFAVSVLCVGFGYLAWVDLIPARIMADSTNGPAGAEALVSLAPFDSRGWYYSGLYAKTPQDAIEKLTRANEQGPSPRVCRALARAYVAAGQKNKGIAVLKDALQLDPNNLSALSQLLELQDSTGQKEDAIATAERLVKVEDSNYYKIRALPEIVPTETLQARQYLANAAETPSEKVRWLKGAVETYKKFLELTVPKVKMAAQAEIEMPGMSLDEARKAMTQAIRAAKDLAKAYGELGSSKKKAEAESDRAAFEAVAL